MFILQRLLIAEFSTGRHGHVWDELPCGLPDAIKSVLPNCSPSRDQLIFRARRHDIVPVRLQADQINSIHMLRVSREIIGG
jgi:hypothetical protein